MSSGAPERPDAVPALDEAPCALLTTDAKGMILFANQTFCTWLGMKKGDLIGQKRFQDLLTMGGRIFHQTHWAPLLQMQGSVSEVKLEVKHREGTVLPMILNAVRRERPGAIVHDLAMFIARDRDIYERELLASREELRILVKEATRLQEEAKDRALFAEQMVGIVSHDLRNPLSAIHLGLIALSRGELTSNQLRVLGRISRSTERAHRLIADLLDFTAARVGKGLSVKISAIDLHAAVSETLDELRTAYPDRHIEHVQEGAGTCSADPDRIAQAVGNLVSNAMTYGDPGRQVTVRSRTGSDECAIEVQNFGKPIPEEGFPTLFQPMVRGAAGGAARSVGLGLYIVREIAQAHGGEVAVRSGIDEGTTFTIRFPGLKT